MPNLESQIRDCIDSFVADLTALVKQAALESVQDALGAPPRRGITRTTAKSPRAGATGVARGKRRSADAVKATGEAIVTFVRNNPGESAVAIAASMGLTPKDVRLPIQHLLEQRALKTTGQRRGTKYYVRGASAATSRSGERRRSGTKGRRRR